MAVAVAVEPATPLLDDSGFEPGVDRGPESLRANSEELGPVIENRTINSTRGQPAADAASFVDDPHRSAGRSEHLTGDESGEAGTDDLHIHGGEAIGSVSRARNRKAPTPAVRQVFC